jgi:hypothetical protein
MRFRTEGSDEPFDGTQVREDADRFLSPAYFFNEALRPRVVVRSWRQYFPGRASTAVASKRPSSSTSSAAGASTIPPTGGFKSKTILLPLPDEAWEGFSQCTGEPVMRVSGSDTGAGEDSALESPDKPAPSFGCLAEGG